MNSKKLKQKIAIAVDSHALSHQPYSKREVLNDVRRMESDEDWSLEDSRRARDNFILKGITDYMQRPLTDVAIQRFGKLPDALRAPLENIASNLCITASGGRDAMWLSSLMAEDEHFEATLALRGSVMSRLQESTRSIQEARDALKHSGARCLADLFCVAAA